MAFDPYHKWLGIPKEHRPPTNYQLLSHAAHAVLSPDDRFVAFSAFNAVYVLDLTSEEFVGVMHHAGGVPCFAFLGGGSHLAYAEGEAICLFDLRQRKEIAYFPYESGMIFRFDVAADGRTIITN